MRKRDKATLLACYNVVVILLLLCIVVLFVITWRLFA